MSCLYSLRKKNNWTRIKTWLLNGQTSQERSVPQLHQHFVSVTVRHKTHTLTQSVSFKLQCVNNMDATNKTCCILLLSVSATWRLAEQHFVGQWHFCNIVLSLHSLPTYKWELNQCINMNILSLYFNVNLYMMIGNALKSGFDTFTYQLKGSNTVKIICPPITILHNTLWILYFSWVKSCKLPKPTDIR